MNRYYLSVDIEGVSGVTNRDFCDYGRKYYELGKRYMHHDVNAVIEGILSVDADAELVVRDAHGSAQNLDLTGLHPKAQLISGWGKVIDMVAGLDASYRGVFLVGYHAGGHNVDSVLAHTFSSSVYEIRLNGRRLNEAGLNSIIAGKHNVPIVFLGGDCGACGETRELLEDIEYAVVKESFARDSALCLPLTTTRDVLSRAARTATIKLKDNLYKPTIIASESICEIVLYEQGAKPSIFASLKELLEHDTTVTFDSNRFAFSFKVDNNAHFASRFNLLATLIYSLGH